MMNTSRESFRVSTEPGQSQDDAELRRKYSAILFSSVLVGFGLLLLIGLSKSMTLVDFAATVLTPAAPMLVWALRDFYRQRDAADAQTAARAEIDQLWTLVISGKCGADECGRRSRELQNTIFARRSTNPLILPGLYNRLRAVMETQMNVGAAELLAQAGVE